MNTEISSGTNESSFYHEAFSRNLGILGEKKQQNIKKARVAIAGLGGVGGNCAYALVRLGIGNLTLADPDCFDLPNLNRQMGSVATNIGTKKTLALENIIKSINPYCNVRIFSEGISEKNIDAFLSEADLLIDAIEFFEIETREMLFQKARAKGIFVLNAAAIGFGSSLLTFDPKGMSFYEYFNIKKEMSKEEKLINFAIGVAPALLQRNYFRPEKINFKKQSVPSIVPGTLLAANLVATEVVRLLNGKKIRAIPRSLHFDPYSRKMKKVWLPGGNKNPLQRIKKYFLVKKSRQANSV